MTNVLATWNDGAARRAVVERTTSNGVSAGERVAVFVSIKNDWATVF